jgi:DNA-binding GntR family transcriptional regulator
MTDKPEQTPREIIAKLAAMSDAEFSAFMARHFEQLCKRPQAGGDVGGRQDG